MKKILSIDGGGIRGIIPGQIMVALEEKLKVQTGNENDRLVRLINREFGVVKDQNLIAAGYFNC